MTKLKSTKMRRSKGLIILIGLFAAMTACEKEESIQPSVQDEQINAFVHVNVISMKSEEVLVNQTVIIDNDRIISIGKSDEITIPEGVNTYNATGMYLMPGLTDMHMHTRDDWATNRWPVNPYCLYIANGVTTVRDFGPHGGDLTYVNDWRDEINTGSKTGPKMYTSGRRPGRPWETWADQAPADMVNWNYTNGFDFLKIYSYLSYEDFEEAMMAAQNLDMYTVGHIPHTVGLGNTATLGYNEIAHIEELLYEFIDYDMDSDLPVDEWADYLFEMAIQQFPDVQSGFNENNFVSQYSNKLAEICNILKTNNISVNTTIFLDDLVKEKLYRPDLFLARPEIAYLPADYIEAFNAGEDKHQIQLQGLEFVFDYKYGIDMMLLRELHKAGVNLLLASDAGTATMGLVPGFSIHDELKVLVQNGFTPYEALLTGTVNASNAIEAMNGENDFGTIEVGKRADLVLLSLNPLSNIENTKSIEGVMVRGEWFSKSELEELVNIN